MRYYNYGFISLEEFNTKLSSNKKVLAHVTGSYFTITKFSISKKLIILVVVLKLDWKCAVSWVASFITSLINTLNCMKSSG